MEGVLRENAESAEGVSEGGLEANEKLEGPEPKGADPPKENAEGAEGAKVAEKVVGIEKVNPDEDAGAVGTKLNGAAVEEEAAGADMLEAGAEGNPRLGNDAGADGTEAAGLAGWVAKEPANRKKKNNNFNLTSSNVEKVIWTRR